MLGRYACREVGVVGEGRKSADDPVQCVVVVMLSAHMWVTVVCAMCVKVVWCSDNPQSDCRGDHRFVWTACLVDMDQVGCSRVVVSLVGSDSGFALAGCRSSVRGM